MPQDHNVRNRKHYVAFNRLRLHRSIAPIELIRGLMTLMALLAHFFLGRRSGSL
jgi:hypothetical protein